MCTFENRIFRLYRENGGVGAEKILKMRPFVSARTPENHFSSIIQGEPMPIITIALKEGRSQEQKAKVAQEITRIVAENMDVDPSKIWIRFDDFSPKDFATAGKLHG
jgi:4-oxalocrotonate tautomerase